MFARLAEHLQNKILAIQGFTLFGYYYYLNIPNALVGSSDYMAKVSSSPTV